MDIKEKMKKNFKKNELQMIFPEEIIQAIEEYNKDKNFESLNRLAAAFYNYGVTVGLIEIVAPQYLDKA